MFDSIIFTNRFRELVYHSDISLEKLAEEIDISKGFLYNLIKADNTPSAKVIYKICDYYGVSADWLLGLSDERERK